MKNLLLAARNLTRHKRKTLAVLSALIIGLAGLVVFQGFLSEMMRSWRDTAILGGIGHLQVAGSPGYFDDGEFNPFAYPLPHADDLLDQLSRRPGVKAAFPSTGFVAMVGFGDQSKTLLVKGYPPERMALAPKSGLVKAPTDRFLLGTLESGVPIGPHDADSLVLGQASARILGVRPGDKVTLMAILPGGQLTGRDFTVSGTFSAPEQDNLFAYTDYATATAFTRLTQPPVIDVLLDSVDRVDQTAASLPHGVTVRTWKDLATLFVQVNTMLASFLTVIRSVILIVTLFILANAMNRVVVERMREWGTLRALGAKKRDVLAIVLWEGCLMGALGAGLGILLGFGIAGAINLGGGLSFHQGPQLFQILVKPGLDSLAVNIVPAALVAGLAAVLPALKAIRLSPSECLREI
jgi:putative ABC transport system permease protein